MSCPVDWKKAFFALWRTLPAHQKVGNYQAMDLPLHVLFAVSEEIEKQERIDKEEGF
jgi:hypothetical protein